VRRKAPQMNVVLTMFDPVLATSFSGGLAEGADSDTYDPARQIRGTAMAVPAILAIRRHIKNLRWQTPPSAPIGRHKLFPTANQFPG